MQAENGTLYLIQPVDEDTDPVDALIGLLSKSDLIKMYDQFLVDKEKPARRIYDGIKNAAKDKCPFCGGIGSPRTLDHFLPKAHFPQFSVLPINLVPSCRDCNMEGKAQGFARKAKEQYIHPYRDKGTFFADQWIFARYKHCQDQEPGDFDYYVSPPAGATSLDTARVSLHFKDFDLARRYGIKAGELLQTVLAQICAMKMKGIDNHDIVECLLQPGVDNAPFVNHWQRGMYQALIEHLSAS
jgi:hypothetical protein